MPEILRFAQDFGRRLPLRSRLLNASNWRSTAELLPLATALDYHPASLDGNVTGGPKVLLPSGRGGRRGFRHDQSDAEATDGTGENPQQDQHRNFFEKRNLD